MATDPADPRNPTGPRTSPDPAVSPSAAGEAHAPTPRGAQPRPTGTGGVFASTPPHRTSASAAPASSTTSASSASDGPEPEAGPAGLAGPGPLPAPHPGPRDALTDVAGLRVGHAQWQDGRRLTGTTVVLAPDGGATAAVDVRGGGPGTRETDALDPRNLVPAVDAVVLTGGSAFGLDAASGVAGWLEEQGRGVRVGPHPWQVVPVVPAAALFDLGRGGDWKARPDASLGRAAVEAAAARQPGHLVPQGNVGAGSGAVAGGVKGGIGTASLVLPSGVTVAALVAVNASGSAFAPESGRLYASPDADEAVSPDPDLHAGAARRLAAAVEESAARVASLGAPPLNTTLVVVATDADLQRAQAQKLAGTAHDGLARALRPVHLLTDGDTVFALATAQRPPAPSSPGGPGDAAAALQVPVQALNGILAAGAEVVGRAVAKALLAARGVDGPGGVFPSYEDLYGDLYGTRRNGGVPADEPPTGDAPD
ncbi:P1 family peptidase [Streptomyces sp. NPDC059740]|uniref:P1 family peptidase n=1 Tax=Streptomyces sp. NPDC059740 TaxID=3346926 RepID=UPI00364B010D